MRKYKWDKKSFRLTPFDRCIYIWYAYLSSAPYLHNLDIATGYACNFATYCISTYLIKFSFACFTNKLLFRGFPANLAKKKKQFLWIFFYIDRFIPFWNLVATCLQRERTNCLRIARVMSHWSEPITSFKNPVLQGPSSSLFLSAS